MKKNILNKEILGSISLKSTTSPCFGIIKYGIDSLEVCICANGELWNTLDIGDSIYKELGTDTFTIFKNKVIISKFKYLCCDQ